MQKFAHIEEAVQNAKSIELTHSGTEVYKFKVLPFGERGTYLKHALIAEISEGLCSAIKKIFPDFDYIVSPEPGGHVWGVLVALQLQKSLNILRSSPTYEAKERAVNRKTGYYQHNLYFNHFKRGDRVLIVDDVVSTGGTLDTILATLIDLGVTPVGVQVVYAKSEEYKKIEAKYAISINGLLCSLL